MDYFEIEGDTQLEGEVSISGSKNSILPIIAASLLIKGEVKLYNVPHILDLETLVEIIKDIGVEVKKYQKNELILDSSKNIDPEVRSKNGHILRGTQTLMGAFLAREGRASLPSLGGCNIGARPIDLHIKGLTALGAKFSWESGYLNAEAEKLTGKTIYLDFPSVGATENVILASVFAKGETIIENGSQEPEVYDLITFLNEAGANITINSPYTVKIKGVSHLKPISYTIIPDRIEAATFMIAASSTKSDIVIKNVIQKHSEAIISKLRETNVKIEISEKENIARIKNSTRPVAINVKTLPFPGYPTDAQPQMMALLSIAKGSSIIEENIYENRFSAANELERMGAQIRIGENVAIINGVDKLKGATVKAFDLRAGAALVLAGISAEGKTIVKDVIHIDRGYENFEKKLRGLKLKIARKKGE